MLTRLCSGRPRGPAICSKCVVVVFASALANCQILVLGFAVTPIETSNILSRQAARFIARKHAYLFSTRAKSRAPRKMPHRISLRSSTRQPHLFFPPTVPFFIISQLLILIARTPMFSPVELLDLPATEVTCFGVLRLLQVNAPDSGLLLANTPQYLP